MHRLSHASGDSVSRFRRAGSRPLTTSASVTSSTTERRLALSATQTVWRFSAAPTQFTSSGGSPRTLARGPSTARITSPTVISSGGRASQ